MPALDVPPQRLGYGKSSTHQKCNPCLLPWSPVFEQYSNESNGNEIKCSHKTALKRSQQMFVLSSVSTKQHTCMYEVY